MDSSALYLIILAQYTPECNDKTYTQ